jgi:hypothetical protein
MLINRSTNERETELRLSVGFQEWLTSTNLMELLRHNGEAEVIEYGYLRVTFYTICVTD